MRSGLWLAVWQECAELGPGANIRLHSEATVCHRACGVVPLADSYRAGVSAVIMFSPVSSLPSLGQALCLVTGLHGPAWSFVDSVGAVIHVTTESMPLPTLGPQGKELRVP